MPKQGCQGLAERFWIPRSPQEWNAFAAGLVEKYGPELVYDVGGETLGYPPTWCRSSVEARKMLAALQGCVSPHQIGQTIA